MPPSCQSFKDAALASAATKRKAQPPPFHFRRDQGTPETFIEEPPIPTSPKNNYKSKKCNMPPTKDYEQAFATSEKVRVVPSHKPKRKRRNRETDLENQSPPPCDEQKTTPASPPFKVFRDFPLNHPSIIERPIDSHSLPNLFNHPNLSAYYSTDMVKYPLTANELDISMTGQPAHQHTNPTYDTPAVENSIGYMCHVVTNFFAHRPNVLTSDKEDRANLFTKLNIVSRALLHTK